MLWVWLNKLYRVSQHSRFHDNFRSTALPTSYKMHQISERGHFHQLLHRQSSRYFLLNEPLLGMLWIIETHFECQVMFRAQGTNFGLWGRGIFERVADTEFAVHIKELSDTQNATAFWHSTVPMNLSASGIRNIIRRSSAASLRSQPINQTFCWLCDGIKDLLFRQRSKFFHKVFLQVGAQFYISKLFFSQFSRAPKLTFSSSTALVPHCYIISHNIYFVSGSSSQNIQ